MRVPFAPLHSHDRRSRHWFQSHPASGLLVRSASSDEQMVPEAGRLVGGTRPSELSEPYDCWQRGTWYTFGNECLLCRRVTFQGPKPGALATTLPHCIFSCSAIPGGWPSSKDQQVLLDSIPGASETAQYVSKPDPLSLTPTWWERRTDSCKLSEWSQEMFPVATQLASVFAKKR